MSEIGKHNLLIDEACRRFPDRCATITPDGQRLSYDMLYRTVLAFTARLRAEGVEPGQVVAPLAENHAVFHALTLALLRIGARVALVFSPDAAIGHGLKIDTAITLADRPAIACGNLVFDQSWFDVTGDAGIGADGDVIMSSSGTTGLPKYYLSSQHNLHEMTRVRWGGYQPGESDTLATLPAPTGYGFWMAYQAMMLGGAIFRPKATARETLLSLQPELPLEILTTPAILSEFLNEIEGGVPVPPLLQSVLLGGSPVSRNLARKAENVLGCPVYNVFGSTETAGNAIARPAKSGLEQGVIGKPFPEVEFRIEAEDRTPLPPGSEGILAVRVPPDVRIAEALVGTYPFDEEGWFRSGDYGYLDAAEGLVLTGRTTDLINSSGSKVSPAAYEAIVLRLTGANEVAAFGIPNALGSEDVGLAIVADTPVNTETLRKQMLEEVGTHLDFHIRQVDSLPVNPTGKVERSVLREQFESEGS